MSDSPITFCVSTFNNLEYLKKALHSVRTYSHFKDAPIVVYDENSTKDTCDWLMGEAVKKYGHPEDKNLYVQSFHDAGSLPGGVNKDGIGGGMNVCAAIARKEFNTKYLMFLHADFFVSKNWDIECLKIAENEQNKNERSWIFSYRIQPNLFAEESRVGTEVVPYNLFGHTWDTFKEDDFIKAAEEFSQENPNLEFNKGEGVSGLIKTSDFLDILNGNDPIYAPAYWEDTDIFLRAQLADFKIILTSNSVVFHFGSRSGNSNFPSDNLVKNYPKGQRSELSKQWEQKSGEAFLKKWGFFPVHNEHGFVTFPPDRNKEDFKHLIKVKSKTE